MIGLWILAEFGYIFFFLAGEERTNKTVHSILGAHFLKLEIKSLIFDTETGYSMPFIFWISCD